MSSRMKRKQSATDDNSTHVSNKSTKRKSSSDEANSEKLQATEAYYKWKYREATFTGTTDSAVVSQPSHQQISVNPTFDKIIDDEKTSTADDEITSTAEQTPLSASTDAPPVLIRSTEDQSDSRGGFTQICWCHECQKIVSTMSSNEESVFLEEPEPTAFLEEPEPTVFLEEPQPTVFLEEPQPTLFFEEPQPTVFLEEPQPTLFLGEPQPNTSRVFEENSDGSKLSTSEIFRYIYEVLGNKQYLITACLNPMRQFAERGLEVLTKKKLNDLQKNIISLRSHFDSAVNGCNSSWILTVFDCFLEDLTTIFKELQIYKSLVKSLKQWLNAAKKEFYGLQASMGALSKIESKQELISSFINDVDSHQDDHETITMAAEQLIIKSQDYLKTLNIVCGNLTDILPPIEASKSGIKSEVQGVTNVFRNFLGEVIKLSDNYSILCSNYRYYVELAEKAKFWISDVKKSSQQVIEEPIADEPSGVDDQLEKIKLIRLEVLGQQIINKNYFQALHVLNKTVNNCNFKICYSRDIEVTTNELLWDYIELLNSIGDRVKELQQLQDIIQGLDRILKWLEEIETVMELQSKPFSWMIEKVEEQAKVYKILKSHTENQKQRFEKLASSAKEIPRDSSPKLAEKVDTTVKDISEKFDNLSKKISKRLKLLEDASQFST